MEVNDTAEALFSGNATTNPPPPATSSRDEAAFSISREEAWVLARHWVREWVEWEVMLQYHGFGMSDLDACMYAEHRVVQLEKTGLLKKDKVDALYLATYTSFSKEYKAEVIKDLRRFIPLSDDTSLPELLQSIAELRARINEPERGASWTSGTEAQ